MFLLHFGFFIVIVMFTVKALNYTNLSNNAMKVTMFINIMTAKDLTSFSTI